MPIYAHPSLRPGRHHPLSLRLYSAENSTLKSCTTTWNTNRHNILFQLAEMAGSPSKADHVIIVGAGVFGLSTAIHLAQRGYNNISVFDRHDYDKFRYSYFRGADAASADMNKIIRSAYGGVSIYQDLSLEAIDGWRTWNADIRAGRHLPNDMSRNDRVFIHNGNLIMTDARELPPFDQATVDSMEKAGHINTQLVTTNAQHRAVAQAMDLGFAIDPFRREQKRGHNIAVLDSTGGLAVADKACCYALQKARDLGVNFIFGPDRGSLHSFIRDDGTAPQHVTGIRTEDGVVHKAKLIIVACGGWTPSLLTCTDSVCETTAGSVAFIKIPRTSPLWERFSPDNFPTWQYKMRDGAEGGLYGFPRDEAGWLKIGYRGTKYTNPLAQADGKERSVPVTRWSSAQSDGHTIAAIPRQAMQVIQRFISENLPEVEEEGLKIEKTRLCWYNDSFDDHLLIDHVPDTDKSLLVATAGSGHAFKYLPVIGKYVADRVEGVGQDAPSMTSWQWRYPEPGTEPRNRLMEGKKGPRALDNVSLIHDTEVERLSSTNRSAKL